MSKLYLWNQALAQHFGPLVRVSTFWVVIILTMKITSRLFCTK